MRGGGPSVERAGMSCIPQLSCYGSPDSVLSSAVLASTCTDTKRPRTTKLPLTSSDKLAVELDLQSKGTDTLLISRTFLSGVLRHCRLIFFFSLLTSLFF